MLIDRVDVRPPRSHYLDFQSGSPLVPPLTVREAPPISANQLLGTTLDELRLGKLADDPYSKRQMNGFALADTSIRFFEVSGQKPKAKEYIGVVQAGLRGERFNQLLYAIAPYKGLGLDTNDCITDWGRVDNPAFQYTIPKHIKGLGLSWTALERDRKLFIWVLELWQQEQRHPFFGDKTVGLIPAVRWVNEDGTRKWRLNYLKGEPYKGIKDRVARNAPYPRVNPVVGLYAAAHFSPEAITNWPERDSYTPGGALRVLGTTQVVAYAIEKSYQFLNGDFVQAAEQYVVAQSA